MNVDLSILIVTYNNLDIAQQCIESIIANIGQIDFEIIVIDNSNDQTIKSLNDSLKLDEKFVYYHMGYNSGFGRANNQGIKLAKGEYILFLNSDIIIQQKDTFLSLYQAAVSTNQSKKTIVGCHLTNEDGSFQKSMRLSFHGLREELWRNPLYIKFVQKLFKKNYKKLYNEKENQAHYTTGFVTWINAAFLMMNRKSILENNLLFDEDFFLYGEDMEFAWRANKLGFKYYHWSKKGVTHIGSASSANPLIKRCQVIVSDWLFIKKTRGKIYLALLILLVKFNINIDILLSKIAKIRKKEIHDNIQKEMDFKPIYKYLLKKYGFKILIKNKLSSDKQFYTNCYEDPFLNEKTK